MSAPVSYDGFLVNLLGQGISESVKHLLNESQKRAILEACSAIHPFRAFFEVATKPVDPSSPFSSAFSGAEASSAFSNTGTSSSSTNTGTSSFSTGTGTSGIRFPKVSKQYFRSFTNVVCDAHLISILKSVQPDIAATFMWLYACILLYSKNEKRDALRWFIDVSSFKSFMQPVAAEQAGHILLTHEADADWPASLAFMERSDDRWLGKYVCGLLHSVLHMNVGESLLCIAAAAGIGAAGLGGDVPNWCLYFTQSEMSTVDLDLMSEIASSIYRQCSDPLFICIRQQFAIRVQKARPNVSARVAHNVANFIAKMYLYVTDCDDLEKQAGHDVFFADIINAKFGLVGSDDDFQYVQERLMMDALSTYTDRIKEVVTCNVGSGTDHDEQHVDEKVKRATKRLSQRVSYIRWNWSMFHALCVKMDWQCNGVPFLKKAGIDLEAYHTLKAEICSDIDEHAASHLIWDRVSPTSDMYWFHSSFEGAPLLLKSLSPPTVDHTQSVRIFGVNIPPNVIATCESVAYDLFFSLIRIDVDNVRRKCIRRCRTKQTLQHFERMVNCKKVRKETVAYYQFWYAILLVSDQHTRKRGVNYMLCAARNGIGMAQAFMCRHYLGNASVAQLNWDLAFVWATKAAQNGSIDAHFYKTVLNVVHRRNFTAGMASLAEAAFRKEPNACDMIRLLELNNIVESARSHYNNANCSSQKESAQKMRESMDVKESDDNKPLLHIQLVFPPIDGKVGKEEKDDSKDQSFFRAAPVNRDYCAIIARLWSFLTQSSPEIQEQCATHRHLLYKALKQARLLDGVSEYAARKICECLVELHVCRTRYQYMSTSSFATLFNVPVESFVQSYQFGNCEHLTLESALLEIEDFVDYEIMKKMLRSFDFCMRWYLEGVLNVPYAQSSAILQYKFKDEALASIFPFADAPVPDSVAAAVPVPDSVSAAVPVADVPVAEHKVSACGKGQGDDTSQELSEKKSDVVSKDESDSESHAVQASPLPFAPNKKVYKTDVGCVACSEPLILDDNDSEQYECGFICKKKGKRFAHKSCVRESIAQLKLASIGKVHECIVCGIASSGCLPSLRLDRDYERLLSLCKRKCNAAKRDTAISNNDTCRNESKSEDESKSDISEESKSDSSEDEEEEKEKVIVPSSRILSNYNTVGAELDQKCAAPSLLPSERKLLEFSRRAVLSDEYYTPKAPLAKKTVDEKERIAARRQKSEQKRQLRARKLCLDAFHMTVDAFTESEEREGHGEGEGVWDSDEQVEGKGEYREGKGEYREGKQKEGKRKGKKKRRQQMVKREGF